MTDQRVAGGFQDAGSFGTSVQVTERREVLASRPRIKQNGSSWAGERTNAGLASARARGRKGGRKPKLTPQQI